METTLEKMDKIESMIAVQERTIELGKKSVKNYRKQLEELRCQAKLGDIIRCVQCNEITFVSEAFIFWSYSCHKHRAGWGPD